MLTIPGYRVTEQIFQSKRSLIYRAVQESDERPVILKMPAQPYPPPEKVAAFQREYEVTRGLPSTAAIGAYALESHQGRVVLVLEDIGGESLSRWAQQRRRTVAEILTVGIAVADALAQIHQRQVMHKDVNPSNIVINPATGVVKLIDFGISAVLSRENATLRSPDVIEGTLAYISPEQTGRMNRAIDYRTDFYSLGVTLYELLTGALPFESTDALELVHAHLARLAPPPHDRDPRVPAPLSAVVMKLMAKNAEHRYQSGRGIKADLEECQRRLAHGGRIEPFALGRHDVSDRFQIPQKLYGREGEIATLLAAFGRVAAGASEVVLVEGHAGIGKSAVVQEIYRPITRERGYFIAGKFEQFQRNIPFASLVQAFQSLVRQLLTEKEARIAAWRERLLGALGMNAQVMIEVIPDLELILGPQPQVPALEPRESENRFRLVFQSFIRVFAAREHPLVLFLDDLQWADGASLQLIEVLAGTGDHQLIIGAYRDNEVGPAHPLLATTASIRKAGGAVTQIALRPLSPASVNELIADAVGRGPEEVAALGEIAYAKTRGNPFFLGELLKSLHAGGLLAFDASRGGWAWDIDRIAAADVTGDVVELMAAKVRRLNPRVQRILKLASCIGASFELTTLATVHERSPRETAGDLWEAMAEGLVLPLGESYKLMTLDVQGLAESVRAEYRFAHDRVQQAAYSLIPEGERPAMHRRVGQLLLRGAPEGELEHRLFDVVNHLNQGRSCIEGDAERRELARLNLLAGSKARASTAYGPALEHLKVGVELLGDAGWGEEHDLTLALHVEATEAACLATDFEEMQRVADVVLARATGDLEKAEVHDVLIQAAIAQNRSIEAVEIGRRALALLGVALPESPTAEDIGRAAGEVTEAIAGRAVEELVDLPEMTDPHRLMEMRINNRIQPPAYRVVPALFPLVGFRTIALLIRHGNNPQAPFAYVMYGLMLCATGEIELGHRFGQLGVRLLDRLPSRPIECRTRYIATAFVGHWKEPAHAAPPLLADAYRIGVTTGDFEFAGFSALMYCCFSYFTGANLGDTLRETAAYIEAIAELKQQTPLTYTRIHHQAMLNLVGEVADPCRLAGESYDEDAMRPVHVEANDMISLAYAAVNRLILCYLFEDPARALRNAEQAEQLLSSLAAMPHVPIVHFYASLARLAAAPTMDEAARAAALEKVAESQQILARYAEHAPMTQAHRVALIEAERARVLREDSRAMEHYWRAIQLAEANRFVNEKALAKEAFARFWLEKGSEEIAQLYMGRAHQQYQLWGAAAKVRDLERRYARLLAGVGAQADAGSSGHTMTSSTGTTMLDLKTVLKASQAISREIVLSELLRRMMSIVVENAGAQRGVLLLYKQDRPVMVAEGGVDRAGVTILEERELRDEDNLARTVVASVARTQQTVVLNDAAVEGAFTRDPYVASARPRSILCMPIVHQGKVIGILYLENSAATGAFTPDRVEVLTLLCTQTAISLENVMVYRTLEEKVQERTRELRQKTLELEQALAQLRQMQEQIIVQEKMASLGALTAGIAHEIRNPLNFLINFAELSVDLVRELREELPAAAAADGVGEVIGSLDQNIRKIHEHGEKVSRIVSSMLAHSGRSASEPEAADIGLLLEDALNLASYGAQTQDPSFGLRVDRSYDGALGSARVVPQEISRVFLNILNNACYALQEKRRALGAAFTPELKVSTRRVDRGLEIRIRDNGPGISAVMRDKIFNPFFTTKPAGKGVGLGLSLSYDLIVKRHRGTLAVESAEGEFAEFIITLPA